jgi:ABC-2 type transport system permease protein
VRQFVAFVKKEFLHIARDRWTAIILLAMPILMLTLFGYAITTEVRNANVAVCDPSRDGATRAIVDKLGASPYFKITQALASPDEADAAFKGGDLGLVVVFGEHFAEEMARTGEARIELIADGSDPNTATALTNYAESIILSYLRSDPSLPPRPYQIVPQVKLLYNPQMKGAYNFVPGVMGMVLMLICAMMTSISIAREKEKGSMEVLLVSPMRPLLIILAKAVPYLALSCVNLATILVLSYFVLGVPIAGSLFWLIVVSVVFIFLALALGLLISSAVSSQSAALLISGMALMLPIMLLSGMIFPVENMPPFLQALSCLIPARWYIAAVRKLMIKGLGLGAIAKELGILCGMAALILAVSLKRFKVRLE